MGLALQVVCWVVKLFAIAVALVVQGSAGYNISPFPAIFFLNPPVNEGNLGRITNAKISVALRPASQPNVSQPAPVLAPVKSVPMPQMIKGVVSSLSPSPPTLLPPYSSVSSSLTIHGIVPSLPPTVPQRKDQEYKNLIPLLAAPTPVASPVPQAIKAIVPSLSPSTPLVLPPYSSSPPPLDVHGIVPSLPPSASQKEDLKYKNPISAPAVPVPVASPIPQRVEGIVPSLSPSTPTVLPPHDFVPSPLTVHGIVPPLPPSVPQKVKPINKNRVFAPVAPHSSSIPPDFIVHGIVPSLPPSVPQRGSPNTKNPVSAPVAQNPVSAPVAPVSSPSNKSSQKPPAIHPIIPGSMPPSSHENIAPVPNASTPKKMPESPPPFAQPIMPGVPPYIFPVPIASPRSNLSPNSPTIQPIIPREPPSNLPEPSVSSVSPPSTINWKSDGMPVAAPPNETSHQFLPWNPSPDKELGVSPVSPSPITNQKSDGMPIAAPPNETPHQISPWNPSPNKEFGVFPLSPPPIIYRKSDGVPIVAPPNETSHQFLPWNPSPNEELGVSPVSPSPITNQKSDGMPIAASPNETPHQISPWNPSPNKEPGVSPVSPSPITNRKSDGVSIAAPPNETPHQISPWNPSPNKELGVSPVSPPPITNQKIDGMPIAAPPNETPHQISPWNPSPNKEFGVSPVSPPSITNQKSDGTPIVAPPNETPHQISPWNPSPNKEPGVSPVSPSPITNRKSDGVPIAAPPNETPHQISPWNPSPNKELGVSPISPPPITNQRSDGVPIAAPPNETPHQFSPWNPSPNKGPYIAPAPSYAISTHPNSEQLDHAPPPRNPESHVSPEPSAYPKAPSGQNILPFLSPKISPSGSSPRHPNMPNSTTIEALPPPPPNEDCLSLACVEPLTNPLPGSPCDCVLPMQVGLRLSVALYTFFPLVSELAEEISVGVFMKQSQVRIMGANEASQDPEKTIVLADLVPLGEKFDNTTAYLTFQRFWHKQVEINNSLFGDYDVLYVYYPGLPPSPPSNTNGGPDSDHGNNGATMHPLGVDVKKRRHKAGPNRSLIAIIVLSASMAVILCCAVAWVWLFKHRDCQRESTSLATLPYLSKPSGTAASMIGSGPSSVSLSFESSFATYAGSAKTFSAIDIERATDNFNASRVLGEGGFGRVYSGVLEDGTQVAIKVLKRDDRQGGREFLAEVEMLSRLHHRNLVKLIGICIEERSRCLVYELIPNGSVESHLHGIDKETAPLDWSARIKIALGAARGLAYLHEDSSPRVIHRDFKSSNILLEHDFTPKLSDFGLARTALDEENRHISTRVMGTFGYVAPEYAMTGHLLVKSDVYSYGVVLLELLTGRKPVDMSQPPGQENLVAWTRPLLTSKEGLESIIDPSLGPNFPFDSIAKVAAIASMCAQPEVSHRPSMGEVVQALKLVCNQSEETKELRSRSCSQDDAGVVSINSGQLRDPLQALSLVSNYNSGIDVERGLSVSDLLSSAAVLGVQESWSFRRHSSSGSLGTGRGRHLWQKIRSLSRGTASEHGTMFRLRPRSH